MQRSCDAESFGPEPFSIAGKPRSGRRSGGQKIQRISDRQFADILGAEIEQ